MHSYVSPTINHVVLPNLMPGKKYSYKVGDGSKWSQEKVFRTLSLNSYPIRIGLIGDIGQTYNSSTTRDHMLASKPQAIINMADLSYADDYSAQCVLGGSGTCQARWDSFSVMWEPLWSVYPVISSAGNHELETSGINASVTYNDTVFSYPTNYPFQAWSARYPVPVRTFLRDIFHSPFDR